MDIKKIRETALYTQKEFADIIGVSEGCVSQWEREIKHPSLRNLRKIKEFCVQHNIEY